MTKYNLVIVVLSMFMLLCEGCMIFVHVLWPIINLCIHLLKIGLFAFSIYGQTAPDTIDPLHENHGVPWYIKYNCNVSYFKSDVGYCRQAKAWFYVSVFMLCVLCSKDPHLPAVLVTDCSHSALFAIHAIISIYAMLFAPDVDPYDDAIFTPVKEEDERQWEMVRIPDTPGTTGGLKSPMTPRTRAFNELEGGPPTVRTDLPLREKYAGYVYQGYNAQ
jgi:hypothetical protein